MTSSFDIDCWIESISVSLGTTWVVIVVLFWVVEEEDFDGRVDTFIFDVDLASLESSVDAVVVTGCESGVGMTVLLLVVVVFLAITPRARGWFRLAGGL